MKLYLTVKPGAKSEKVEKVDASHFRIWVKAPPAEGKANEAVIEILSEYFGRPKSAFSLLAGQKSKRKIVHFKET